MRAEENMQNAVTTEIYEPGRHRRRAGARASAAGARETKRAGRGEQQHELQHIPRLGGGPELWDPGAP